MKEFSIEEKAKAYDEAKARMSKAYNENRCTTVFMNEIFPELKESEDERIKKDLIDFIKHKIAMGSINQEEYERLNSWIAWLEKQGEQKPAEWRITDEDMFRSAVWHIKNSISNGKPDTITKSDILDWFITLKERVYDQRAHKKANLRISDTFVE